MQAPPARHPTRHRRRAPLPLVAVAVAGGVLALVAGAWLILRSPVTDPPAATAPAAPLVPFELRAEGAEPVRVRLEVAATAAERRLGLMHRTEVPAGTGMVFLFPEDTVGGFWMRNTLVPLSIAFVGEDGRVVSVHEMVPCRADPCRLYRPTGPYRYAVELPAGAFPAAGIGPGDEVVAVDPASLPAAS
jgi:uncharacterized protein